MGRKGSKVLAAEAIGRRSLKLRGKGDGEAEGAAEGKKSSESK